MTHVTAFLLSLPHATSPWNSSEPRQTLIYLFIKRNVSRTHAPNLIRSPPRWILPFRSCPNHSQPSLSPPSWLARPAAMAVGKCSPLSCPAGGTKLGVTWAGEKPAGENTYQNRFFFLLCSWFGSFYIRIIAVFSEKLIEAKSIYTATYVCCLAQGHETDKPKVQLIIFFEWNE